MPPSAAVDGSMEAGDDEEPGGSPSGSTGWSLEERGFHGKTMGISMGFSGKNVGEMRFDRKTWRFLWELVEKSIFQWELEMGKKTWAKWDLIEKHGDFCGKIFGD